MDLRWRLAQDDGDQDFQVDLLPKEITEGQRYRHAARHRQWQHGRHLAKALLREEASALGIPAFSAQGLWIRRSLAGWPQVLDAAGHPQPVKLSISHCGAWAVAAACRPEQGRVGVDLEKVEPRSQAFIGDYFSPGEIAIIQAGEPARSATLLWTIKEAVLKSLGVGLSEATTAVQVRELPMDRSADWQTATVSLRDHPAPQLWWRLVEGDHILSLALLP